MARHRDLQDSGQIPHRDIDALLPTTPEKNTLRGADLTTFYFGDPNRDGSWRITITGNDLAVQHREAGSWVTKGDFTP